MIRAARFTIHAFISHGRAIAVIGLGFGLLIVQQATQFKSLFGSSAADQAAAISGMQSLGRTFAVLIPPPVRVDTVAGFVDWRLLSAGTVYVAIYATIAGAAAIRGEEEKGLVEIWLASGLGRTTLVVCRAAAMTLALVAAATLAAAIGIAGTRSPDLSLPAAELATTTFLVMVPGLFFFALAMLVAQVLPTRRGAAGLVGSLAGLTFVLANLSYVTGGLSLVRWLSPFLYYDEGHALAEGTVLRPVYPVIVLVATIAVVAAAALVFRRRDLNVPLMRGEDRRAAQPNELLRYPTHLILATINELRWTIAGWTAGIVVLAALDTASVKSVAENLGNSTVLRSYLASLGSGGQFAIGFLNFAVFVLGATLVATLAINVIGHFAADQEERRVEIELAQPVTTLDLQLARGAALAVAVVIPAAALLVTVVITAKLTGVDLRGSHLWSATLMVLPLALSVGAIGLALLPRFSHQAVGVLSTIVGISFAVTILGSVSDLNLPDWLLRLTLIRAYGSPAVHGIEAGGLVVLVALILVGVAGSAAQARAEMTTG